MKNITILLGLHLFGLLSACSSQTAPIANEEKFPITSPIMVDTTVLQEYVADIQAIQNVEIRARIKGFIEKIHVDEGGTVQAGTLMFSISNQIFKQELLRADAQLKSAIAEAKMIEVGARNTQILVEKGIVSKSELEMAEAKQAAALAKIEEMRSAVSSAQLNLAFTEIRAPFSGIINRQPLKMGSLVDEGTLLTTISNNESVFVYFNVSEKEYLHILKDKKENHLKQVNLILADGHAFPYQGKIETMESEIDRNTGNLAFRARFENPERLLKHGASGKIQLAGNLENALIIPQKATFEIQGNTYLFLLDKDNTIKTRKITIRYRFPHLYVVQSGLSESDRIVYEGIQRLKEGDKILPEMRPMRSIMNQLAVN